MDEGFRMKGSRIGTLPPGRRIVIREDLCAYCGEHVDPRDPGIHVATCTKHPAYRYKQALERILQAVDEIAAQVGQVSGATTAASLDEAATKARREAFGPTWMPHPNGEGQVPR